MINVTAPKHRIRSFFLYVLYACVLTGILLFVFFPSDKIRQYCTQTVARMVPGTKCLIGSIKFDFPLTLHFSNIRLIGAKKSNETLFFIQSMSVRASFGQPGFHIQARIYDGDLQCRVVIDRNQKTFTLSEVQLHHFNLGKWPGLRNSLQRDISGHLDISGRYSGRSDQILSGEAEGVATVYEGSMELLQPILTLSSVDFSRSEMKFTLGKGNLTLKEGTFHGREFDGTFTGKFHLTFPLNESMLELTGELAPTQSLVAVDRRWANVMALLRNRYRQPKLPFTVSGTLIAPQFRFGN